MVSLSASPCSGGGSMCVTASLFLAHTHPHARPHTNRNGSSQWDTGVSSLARTDWETALAFSFSLPCLFISLLPAVPLPRAKESLGLIKGSKGHSHDYSSRPSTSLDESVFHWEKTKGWALQLGERTREAAKCMHTSHFIQSVRKWCILINLSCSLGFCPPFSLSPSIFSPLLTWSYSLRKESIHFSFPGQSASQSWWIPWKRGAIEGTESLFIRRGSNWVSAVRSGKTRHPHA